MDERVDGLSDTDTDSARRPLIVGNWKMHGTAVDLPNLDAIDRAAADAAACDVVMCLPATLLSRAAARLSSAQLGAQDCHAGEGTAHTGQHDAAMLADAGARWVLLGHSECRVRRALDDADIARQVAAIAGVLRPIVCVGDDGLRVRDARAVADQALASLPDALVDGLVLAYEPVWAIGSGRTPTMQEIGDACHLLREAMQRRYGAGALQTPILYGGSVDADNAADILTIDGVAGVLVGGASRDPRTFGAITSIASGTR